MILGLMIMEIQDVNDLIPIVKKTLKNAYGTEIEGIKIIKTDRGVYRWHVTTEFEDHEHLYTNVIDVREFDGKAMNIAETKRQKKEKIKPTGKLGTSPPHIQAVHISETKQEIIRIAVAQFCFELTESFPFTVENKDEVKTKIFSALEIARKGGANIVCLPELCLCKEWISEIKGKYPDMIVIGGSFYKDNKNICPIIMESETDIPYQPKITPSPFEDGIMGPRMIPGDRIYRYETRFGKFVILICMDFDDLAHFFREADIDMIFCPSLQLCKRTLSERGTQPRRKNPLLHSDRKHRTIWRDFGLRAVEQKVFWRTGRPWMQRTRRFDV